jgi:energy-coupling factor transporter ATP-binding protein EcfA2
MDPIKNPFSPGAGSPPPELVGRDPILEQARILFGRVKAKRPEKSMLLTGLRGVGKTVLLNAIDRIAREEAGYRTEVIEAHEGKELGPLLVPGLRSLLFELNRLSGIGDKVKRGLAVLRSFISSIQLKLGEMSLSLDIEPETGKADSGDIEIDLPDLMIAIGEAAEDKKSAIAILIDEIQYFNQKELGALIMAMHKVQQRSLPIVLLGAGLPILPGLAGDSKSYAERLFSFPEIGALSKADSARALQEPAKAARVAFTAEALEEVYRLTKGYPYFVQEWGYSSWNLAASSPIGKPVIERATEQVLPKLDGSFFRVRYDRLTPSEKRFLRAMADLGPGPQRAADIADRLGVKVNSISPTRANLIKKGMIYSPEYGDLAFTVPLFDEFMLRAIPVFKKKA